MRTTLALLSLLPAVSVLAQNPTVDLALWTAEHLNGTGPWTVDPTRLFTESTNTMNTDVSVFYSDFDVTLLDFRITVDPLGGDDDLMGFVLGWQPGDSSNPTADYIVVDWKRLTQTYQDWGTSLEGLAISRMTGPFTRGFGTAPIDLWSHTLNCTELARGATFGSTGWSFATDYRFRVLYTPGSVDVWLDGAHEFSITGTFTPGRFGCYNYSQSRTGFQFPLAGGVTLYGSGCQGTAGAPYMFVPVLPYVGETLPIVTANLNPTALPFVILGVSRTSFLGNPLPFALDTYGAPGCSVLASGELLLLATNHNGTAWSTFDVPLALPPSAVPALYAQSMVIDPAANGLGIVLSNAAEIAVGIR